MSDGLEAIKKQFPDIFKHIQVKKYEKTKYVFKDPIINKFLGIRVPKNDLPKVKPEKPEVKLKKPEVKPEKLEVKEKVKPEEPKIITNPSKLTLLIQKLSVLVGGDESQARSWIFGVLSVAKRWQYHTLTGERIAFNELGEGHFVFDNKYFRNTLYKKFKNNYTDIIKEVYED